MFFSAYALHSCLVSSNGSNLLSRFPKCLGYKFLLLGACTIFSLNASHLSGNGASTLRVSMPVEMVFMNTLFPLLRRLRITIVVDE